MDAWNEASTYVRYQMSPDWSELRALNGSGLLSDSTQANTAWLTDYVFSDDRAAVMAAVKVAIAEKEVFDCEHRILLVDGTVGWTHSRAVPLLDDRGNITEWIGAASDITARKDAETALRDTVEKYEKQSRLFEGISSTTPDFIYVFGLDRRFLYANRRLLEVWGKTFDEAVGRSLLELGYPQWHADMHHREIDQVIATKQPIKGNVPFTGGSGIFGVYEYIFSPVLGPDGEVEVIAGTTRDVTEREKFLANERKARVESEQNSRMKDEFLATLSHELRTPMSAVLGWSQLLRRNTKPELLAQGLDTIERNARAQTRIIEDLLDMSRITNGKIRLDVQRLDPSSVINAAIDTVRHAADAKGVRLNAVLDPLARPVSGDPNRLQQVFWNLLTNAVKFTPKGGRVQVVLERVNSHIEISVSDTGDGIQPDFLPYVFDRFRQADASTTRKHGGLGLGLSIVKQLVELHGGEVRVKSAGEGQGSTFIVALPLTVLHHDNEPEPPRRHPLTSADPNDWLDGCAELQGRKILVVDDEPDARTMVQRLLEECGAKVITTASAAEVSELIRIEKPDLLISDIGMPEEDGYSLIRRLRKIAPELGGNIPAVALTAFARPEDRVRALRAGFNSHVVKPVDPAELVTVVASLTRDKR